MIQIFSTLQMRLKIRTQDGFVNDPPKIMKNYPVHENISFT